MDDKSRLPLSAAGRIVKKDITSASVCDVAVRPPRCPSLESWEIFNRAKEQLPFAESVKTSDGLKDVRREVARVDSRSVDGSWILNALTIAMHSDDLKWRNVSISFICCLLLVKCVSSCTISCVP